MGSVYTIEGASAARPKRKRSRKPSRPLAPGECRLVEMPNGCRISLCKPESGGRPKFKKGTKRC